MLAAENVVMTVRNSINGEIVPEDNGEVTSGQVGRGREDPFQRGVWQRASQNPPLPAGED